VRYSSKLVNPFQRYLHHFIFLNEPSTTCIFYSLNAICPAVSERPIFIRITNFTIAFFLLFWRWRPCHHLAFQKWYLKYLLTAPTRPRGITVQNFVKTVQPIWQYSDFSFFLNCGWHHLKFHICMYEYVCCGIRCTNGRSIYNREGMEFQVTGDEQERVCWPIVRFVRVMVKRDWSLDRSWCEGVYGVINSQRYASWPEEKAL